MSVTQKQLIGWVKEIAKENDLPESNVWAVIQVESSGEFTWTGGRIPILLERHWVYRIVKRKHGKVEANRLSTQNPNVCNPRSGGYGKYSDQYRRLVAAINLCGEYAAHMATSFGAFQIMGFNYKHAGYNSAKEMSDAFHNDPYNQVKGFVTFLKNYKDGRAFNALQLSDWHTFARLYNGSHYMKNRYVQKLMAAEASYKG